MVIIDDLVVYTGILGGAVIGGEILSMILKKTNNKSEKLATAEFGTVLNLKRLLGKDGVQISKQVRLSQKASFEGVCLIGPTGAGKSTALMASNLLNDDVIPGSLVIADPKLELYKLTSKHLEKKGYKTMIYCPLSPLNSHQYNPLKECRTTEEVTQLAETILLNGDLSIRLQSGRTSGNGEWIQMSVNLLAAALLYCKRKPYPMDNINQALRLLINNKISNIELLFNNSDEDVMEQYNIFKTVSGSDKTASSILITLASSLKLFLDENVFKTTMRSNFNGKLLRDKRIALFISIPERRADAYSPITATIYSQLITQSMDYDGNPITWFWDEFCNIGLIPSVTKIVSTGRSRQHSYVVCLQDLSQLNNIYGKNNTQTILNNLKVKVVMPGLSDMETLEYISNLCGETEVKIKSTSSTTAKGETTTSVSYSTQRKKLISPDEVRRLDEESILIIPHNKKVVIDKQNIYYKQAKYLSNAAENELPIV